MTFFLHGGYVDIYILKGVLFKKKKKNYWPVETLGIFPITVKEKLNH